MQFYKIFYIAERTQTDRQEGEGERAETVHKICWIYILKTLEGRRRPEGGRQCIRRATVECECCWFENAVLTLYDCDNDDGEAATRTVRRHCQAMQFG